MENVEGSVDLPDLWRARGGCSSPVVVRVVILTVGARRRPWVVGIRAPLLFTDCSGGGVGGLSSSCPIVGVLCVVRHRRVGRSSSVVSVHGISVLCSHRREVIPFRRRPIVVFLAIVLVGRCQLVLVR